MFAHTYSYQLDPSETESSIQFMQHVVVPDIQSQPGFKGVRALVNRQSGKGIGITYWETEADASAAAQVAANPPTPPPGVQLPPIRDISIEVYEVVIDVPK
jgi:heme-degrading monooxygenase HmoA